MYTRNPSARALACRCLRISARARTHTRVTDAGGVKKPISDRSRLIVLSLTCI